MRFVSGLFLAISSIGVVFGGVADHLKRAEEKKDYHHMRNIDFIYMINLDERSEKWEMSCRQLEPYGIYPYRFSAVNGWNLSLEVINDVGLKYRPDMTPLLSSTYPMEPEAEGMFSNEFMTQFGKTYFRHGLARGTVGIILSHLSILQDAFDSGYETIWIMEDDIEVLSDPRKIPDLIEELDRFIGRDNWDVLFTDKNTRDARGNEVPSAGMAKCPNFNPSDKSQYYIKEQISENFHRIGSRFGAYSLIMRRSGIEKILNFIKAHEIYLPYDMALYLPQGIKLYTVTRNIVSNLPKAISDNGHANYLKK